MRKPILLSSLKSVQLCAFRVKCHRELISQVEFAEAAGLAGADLLLIIPLSIAMMSMRTGSVIN